MKLIPSAKGRFYPINPDRGPWLIWSYKWGLWHRRSETGGAAGYTGDITQAGIFDLETARGYHDEPPHRTDVAIPSSKVAKHLAAKALEVFAEAARLTDLAASLKPSRAALSPQEASGKGGAE